MAKLNKLPDDEKARICRIYYLTGFAFLPLMWAINFIWFFKEAFLRKDPVPKIRQYVIVSGVGCVFYSAAFITWVVIFQTKHQDWGETAWKMSMNIPFGEV